MIKLIKTIILIFFASNAFCQYSKVFGDTMIAVDTRVYRDHGGLVAYNHWEYITLSDTFTLEIINHSAHMPSGAGYMSIAIGKTQTGDTVRVLDCWNTNSKFKIGQIVRVVSKEKPNYNAPPPHTLVYNTISMYYEPSYFDLNVAKTTWAMLQN